jgi:hypothetical protein
VFQPPNNHRAVAAYRCAVYGIIPVAGLLLGPVAVGLGILGWRHYRNNPDDRGGGHAAAGMILGSLELLLNGLGLSLIWVGLASLAG